MQPSLNGNQWGSAFNGFTKMVSQHNANHCVGVIVKTEENGKNRAEKNDTRV
jgi:peptide deformylase